MLDGKRILLIVGGGINGAVAASALTTHGAKVALIDRAGRIKPCGGAIPPRLIRDFQIPEEQLVAKITTARMISPTGRRVDIPIENGFVGMVDREHFDEFLRARAARAPTVAAPAQEPPDVPALRRVAMHLARGHESIAPRHGHADTRSQVGRQVGGYQVADPFCRWAGAEAEPLVSGDVQI